MRTAEIHVTHADDPEANTHRWVDLPDYTEAAQLVLTTNRVPLDFARIISQLGSGSEFRVLDSRTLVCWEVKII